MICSSEKFSGSPARTCRLVLLLQPSGASSVRMLSNLQPGFRTRATAAIIHLRTRARLNGVSARVEVGHGHAVEAFFAVPVGLRFVEHVGDRIEAVF